jgi:DNA invertase Pin-like site-specific DNA recombinase
MSYKPPPKELTPGSHVICYLRDSGGGAQELSTGQQLNEVKAYCKKHDLLLIEEFIDAARSGTSTDKRDEFERMIDRCRHEDFTDGLLVWNFARFARNMNDAMYYKADLRRRGIIVHSITDEIPDGGYSHVVEVMIDIANEEKSKQTSRDTKRGLSQRAKDGYIPGGSVPPRGYRAVREVISSHRDGSARIGTKFETDPELGPLVTLAFKMRAEGRSLNEIMNSPCGVLYKTKAGFVTFFRNEAYLGYIKCGETKVYNPETVPPLVDRETWDAVKRLREMISSHALGNALHPKRYHSPSLLSGLAVCIHCGTPIIREVSGAKSTKTGKWIYYVCGKKRNAGNWHACEGKQIKSDRADRAIIEAVLNQILTVDRASEQLTKQVQASYSDNGEIVRQEEATRAALSNCEKSISRLLDTIESTNSATAKARLKERESEYASLQFKLSIITSQRNAAEIEITPEVLLDVLDVWRGEIEAARDQNDIRGLQRCLRKFLVKIELGYFTARLWYTFPINAFANDDVLRLSDAVRRDRKA